MSEPVPTPEAPQPVPWRCTYEEAVASRNFYSEKASEINRQICFGGLATCFFFLYQYELRYPGIFIFCAVLLIGSVSVDLLQMVWGHHYYRDQITLKSNDITNNFALTKRQAKRLRDLFRTKLLITFVGICVLLCGLFWVIVNMPVPGSTPCSS